MIKELFNDELLDEFSTCNMCNLDKHIDIQKMVFCDICGFVLKTKPAQIRYVGMATMALTSDSFDLVHPEQILDVCDTCIKELKKKRFTVQENSKT